MNDTNTMNYQEAIAALPANLRGSSSRRHRHHIFGIGLGRLSSAPLARQGGTTPNPSRPKGTATCRRKRKPAHRGPRQRGRNDFQQRRGRPLSSRGQEGFVMALSRGRPQPPSAHGSSLCLGTTQRRPHQGSGRREANEGSCISILFHA